MYFFIVNLTSRTGHAREIWIRVEKELRRRKVDYEAYVTEYEGHARELARELCTRGAAYLEEAGSFDANKCSDLEEAGSVEAADRTDGERWVCLVVVGGDGTVNEVINGMHHFDRIDFGYIATGSGNDLGRGLGLPKDPLEALDGILSAREPFLMDLGAVTAGEEEPQYFAISSGIGIDADVCRQALKSRLKKFLNHLGLGSLTYVLLTVKALFTMPTTELTISFDDGAGKRIDRMIFVAGMNHPWEGGGVPMAPRADCRDGKLSVCCVYGIPRWKAFFLLPCLVRAKHEGLKGFEIIDCAGYELAIARPMAVHGDGEYLGDRTYVRCRCLPGMLRVMK